MFPFFKERQFKRLFGFEPPRDANTSPEGEHVVGLVLNGLQGRLNQTRLAVTRLKNLVNETNSPVEAVSTLRFLGLARKDDEAADQELRRACELAVHFSFNQQMVTRIYSQLAQIEAEDR